MTLFLGFPVLVVPFSRVLYIKQLDSHRIKVVYNFDREVDEDFICTVNDSSEVLRNFYDACANKESAFHFPSEEKEDLFNRSEE